MKKIYAMLLVFVMVAMLFGCTTEENNLAMVKDKYQGIEVLSVSRYSFMVLDLDYAIYVKCDSSVYNILIENVMLRANTNSE